MLFPNIGYFNTKNEAISDTSKKSPNITYIAEQENVDRGLLYSDFGDNMPIKFQIDDYGNVISTINELIMPLTFIGKNSDNSVQLKWNNLGYSAPVIDMEVSVNDSEWRTYSIDNGTGEVIALSAHDTVKFRGNNETLGSVPPSPGGYWQFIMTGIIEAHGNIMSILDKTRARLNVPEAAFIYMFAGCTSLISAPTLPATTLAQSCYYNMFQGCTSLTIAPALPAITLASSCYSNMFNGCTSLTTAPELPATTLAGSCYWGMFQDCAALTTAPSILPATELASFCYASMFYNCFSLITAPELPAMILAEFCYDNMFNGCTSLTELTVYADDLSAPNCLNYWLNNTASGTTGILHSLGSADFTGNVPSNWSIVRPYQPGYIYVDASEVIPSLWEDEVFIYGQDESTSSPIYGNWPGTSMEYDSSLKLCKIQIFGSYDTLVIVLNDGNHQTIDITLHNITVNNSVVITIHNVIPDAGKYTVDYLIN